jgi:iron complex outermembrane receptor protein
MAIYHIDTQDDLVPYELADFPDRTFYRNAGKTDRNGLELSMNYAFAKDWTFQTSYAYSDFTYGNFTTPNGSFDRKNLPGIPKHTSSFGLMYSNANGFYANLNTNLVGKQYADDGNNVSIDGYEMVNLRAGYVFEFREIEIRPYFGVNNLLNQEYTDNVRINAFGGRYYEPAPTLNIFGGLVLRL